MANSETSTDAGEHEDDPTSGATPGSRKRMSRDKNQAAPIQSVEGSRKHPLESEDIIESGQEYDRASKRANVMGMQVELSDGAGGTSFEKRKLANRESAQRSRDRKNAYIKQVEDENMFFRAGWFTLFAHNTLLQEENNRLKLEIASCGTAPPRVAGVAPSPPSGTAKSAPFMPPATATAAAPTTPTASAAPVAVVAGPPTSSASTASAAPIAAVAAGLPASSTSTAATAAAASTPAAVGIPTTLGVAPPQPYPTKQGPDGPVGPVPPRLPGAPALGTQDSATGTVAGTLGPQPKDAAAPQGVGPRHPLPVAPLPMPSATTAPKQA